MSIDFNYSTFVASFENHLESLGFYLKKNFDDSEKGGRFFEKGGKKNKAMGRYMYIPPHNTSSGKALIIYTFFEARDKTTQKIISSSKTEYFWDKSGGNAKQHTKFDKAEYERKKAQRLASEAALQQRWSKQAYEEYLKLKDPLADVAAHPYLQRKKVGAGRGLIIAKCDLRIGSYYNQFKTDTSLHKYYFIKKKDLIIPAIDLKLNFRTYQKIDPYGNKRQRIDISTVGAFYCLGVWRENTRRIYLVEGYATGYTLHRALDGAVVFVCFDVQNIGVLAQQLKELMPYIDFVICTDNDRKKSTKVGLFKGFEYAYVYDQPFIFPKFKEGAEFDSLSDWNDLATVATDQEIKEMVENQIDFFKTYGKEKCIGWVAQSNGVNSEELIEYAKNSKVKDLFKTMDLILS